MNSNLQYNGKVTIKFYNKDGKLKGTHIQYNHGTPYFFHILEKILSIGTNNVNDERPGRIMLTSPGYIERSSSAGVYTLTMVGGESYFNNDSYYYQPKSADSFVQLSYNIPKVGPNPAYMNKQENLIDVNNNIIPAYTPCIRYEFNISYYDLLESVTSKIGSLDRYRLWLLSSNDTSFNLKDKETQVKNNYPDISNIQIITEYVEANPQPSNSSLYVLVDQSTTTYEDGKFYIEGADGYELNNTGDWGYQDNYILNSNLTYYIPTSDPTIYEPVDGSQYQNSKTYYIHINNAVKESDEDKLLECLLNNITYMNVDKNDSTKLSQICAQTQIKKQENDVDYTLNEGEYVTVIWDMYFQNNPTSEVNE